MKITGIKETCLYVNDIEETYNFYHKKLGFECISKIEDRHVFFRVGPDVLLCFLPEVTKYETTLPPHYADGPQHIAFKVKKGDYEETKRLCEGYGVTITHTQDWGKGEFESFYFEDPSNNILEIVMEGMWG